MNTKDNAKSARATDALLNFETVKYFTNEALEETNFTKAIEEYQVRGDLEDKKTGKRQRFIPL